MNGLVSINKSCGLSSSDIVIKCRNALSHQLGYKVKCGHMGTLDPAASGVMVLGFGKSTRLFDIMQNQIKTYVSEIKFGEETDTLDREGNIILRSGLPKTEDINNVLNSFVGEIEQIPPKYSAISINGCRCYDLARKGIDFKLEARKVTIYEIKVLEIKDINGFCSTLKILIKCSSGTYIRSLVRDISHKLNVVGYMLSLNRTSVGNFNLNNSIDLETFILNPINYLISTKDFLMNMFNTKEISLEFRKKIMNGVACDLGIKDLLTVLTIDNKLYGIGKTENGLTKSIINLWED